MDEGGGRRLIGNLHLSILYSVGLCAYFWENFGYLHQQKPSVCSQVVCGMQVHHVDKVRPFVFGRRQWSSGDNGVKLYVSVTIVWVCLNSTTER